MNEKHIKFVDFIFDEMKFDYGKWFSFDSLNHEFKKSCGIEINYKELDHIAEKFKFDLFDQLGESIKFKLSARSHDMIDEFGSYSNFLEANNDNTNRQKEIEDLSFKVNQLQVNNLEFEKSNEELKRQVLILDKKAKKWNIVKSYWWLIGVLLAIAIFVGDLLDIITS